MTGWKDGTVLMGGQLIELRKHKCVDPSARSDLLYDQASSFVMHKNRLYNECCHRVPG